MINIEGEGEVQNNESDFKSNLAQCQSSTASQPTDESSSPPLGSNQKRLENVIDPNGATKTNKKSKCNNKTGGRTQMDSNNDVEAESHSKQNHIQNYGQSRCRSRPCASLPGTEPLACSSMQ